MKKLGEQPPKRLQILMTDEELADIKEYTHQNKIYGRSAAIRELVKAGLRAEMSAGRFKKPVWPGKNWLVDFGYVAAHFRYFWRE